jgi:HEAT repeat protein
MEEKPIETTATTVEPSAKPPKKKRSRITSMILLVVSFGAFFWAFLTIREEMKPNSDLLRMLRSSDPAVRIEGARRLGNVDADQIEAASSVLMAAQADENEQVRSAVTWSLGSLTMSALKVANKGVSQESAKALTRTLSDPNDQVRMVTIESLGMIVKGSKPETCPIEVSSVVPALVHSLNDESPTVRRSARGALAGLGSSRGIESPTALLDVLNQSKISDSRAQAALALGSFTKGATEPTVKALTQALKDADPEVRSGAAISLRAFAETAASALPTLVATLDDPFVPPVPKPAPTPTGAAAKKIVGTGGAGLPTGPDPAVDAARTIALIADPLAKKGEFLPAEVTTGLLKSLRSSRSALRDASTDVFQTVRKAASAAVPDLIRELTESIPNPDGGFGPTAAATLGDVGPGSPKAADAIVALTSALDAKALATRTNAVVALGRFGPDAMPAMSRLKELGDTEKDLAAAVTTAIQRLKGEIPPDAPRRRGGRRGGGGGGGGGRTKGA